MKVVPLIRYDEKRAHQAWEAYRKLWAMEVADHDLSNNSEWVRVREFAFARFKVAFEGAV